MQRDHTILAAPVFPASSSRGRRRRQKPANPLLAPAFEFCSFPFLKPIQRTTKMSYFTYLPTWRLVILPTA